MKETNINVKIQDVAVHKMVYSPDGYDSSDPKYVYERFGGGSAAQKVLARKEEYQKELSPIIAKGQDWNPKAFEFSEKLINEFGNDDEKEGLTGGSHPGRHPFWACLHTPD